MSTWIRILSVLSVVVIHVSLIPVFFPGVLAPVTLVVVAVAWTAILGFPAVLFPLISTVVICEGILFGSIQFSSLYYIVVAYSVSFFMKRTLLGERSGLGYFILALFAGVSTSGYVLFDWLRQGVWNESLSLSSMLTDFVLAMIVFIVLVPVLKWFESVIRTLRQDSQFSIK